MKEQLDSKAIKEKSAQSGGPVNVLESEAPGGPLLDGKLTFQHRFSEVQLHCTEARELQQATVEAERTVSTTIGVLFEGKLRFALEDKWHQIDVAQNTAVKQPVCFALNILKPLMWKRQLCPGNSVKKITMSMPPLWLEKKLASSKLLSKAISALLIQHAQVNVWPASPQTLERSQAVILGCEDGKDLIELEACVLLMLSSCLKDLHSHHENKKWLPPSSNSSIPKEAMKILRVIESALDKPPFENGQILASVASATGLSISTAQRIFKLNFGQTIASYLRVRRLEVAREQILVSGLSIGEAAYRAGYSHTSNFSIAFKKQFGISPGEL